ncbi:MAG: PhoH family protein [Chitinophagaceae bacterium]|nr:MAG: PhoH family protein [Chitinophagaceae bacterium]
MAQKKVKKIFVLDTSVIIYNHNAINTFQDNDVAIPITVLEELDNFKKGNDSKNFEAREFIRIVDKLSDHNKLNEWMPLNGKTKGNFKVIMEPGAGAEIDAQKIFGDIKADHKILNTTLLLQKEHPDKKVILVSKDINLRLKAKSLNVHAEDYETGKIKNIDTLFTGKSIIENVNPETIDKLYAENEIEFKEITKTTPTPNQFFILKSNKTSALCYYNHDKGKIEKIEKKQAYGIQPRNAEQVFALHAIANPDIKLVTLQGVAGTGKTLLALAGSLMQRRDFRQIYLARPVVPLSNKDIGYLPGDIKSKLNPYMEPLWDNLKTIQNQYNEKDKDFKNITEMLDSEKLMITPLAYIRGRSISNIIFIIDEAQNLTPHEIKTIITRAGENTKIIFTGDIFQIDTPYLDTQSNGLSYLIDKFKGQSVYSHITLEKGERSALANLANDLL